MPDLTIDEVHKIRSRAGNPRDLRQLSDADVVEILRAYGKGERVLEIANRFGVSRETVYSKIRKFVQSSSVA